MLAASIIFGCATILSLGYIVYLKMKSNRLEHILCELLNKIMCPQDEE